ncbi:hypothetical protein ACS0TY_009010 [Phlomoides rotata]
MSWIQSTFGSKTSPIILFTIVVLAVVFFIAAIAHLLVRFLLKQRRSSQPHSEMSTSGPFQRQLQHLFRLHDSGLDQSQIDALPLFLYRDVMGLKEPFDCAVCLCEFSEEDKLRLLPLCSHAFHIDCIDTWLLSNSSCPLCRGVILSHGVSFENPVFYFDDNKEVEDGGFADGSSVINEKRVFSVRLGKYRNGGNQETEMGESSNRNLDCRRCYSMGSFQYVVADSELQVALFPSRRERGRGGGQIGNFTSGGDCVAEADEKRISSRVKGESFSVSKIWMWSKKGKIPSSITTNYSSNAINVRLS